MKKLYKIIAMAWTGLLLSCSGDQSSGCDLAGATTEPNSTQRAELTEEQKALLEKSLVVLVGGTIENSNDISVIIGDNDINGNKKQKILFECSESNGPSSPLTSKKILKKKRLRKNNEQLELLSKFYTENKNWSKKQIKEISESIGLKENKIYKWLWDQKNKEYKVTKFVVNKNKENLD